MFTGRRNRKEGHKEAASLLLAEEKAADEELASIAGGGVNAKTLAKAA